VVRDRAAAVRDDEAQVAWKAGFAEAETWIIAGTSSSTIASYSGYQ
jgi:hypothetical protein